MRHRFLLFTTLLSVLCLPWVHAGESGPATPWQKIEDVIIYQDDLFYCAFPSVVKRPNGELIVAFRRAPNRRVFGAPGNTHTDPNSYLVLVRSQDGGKTWSKKPELIYANPFGGSQDPCLLQLQNGAILCASYGWALLPESIAGKPQTGSRQGQFGFLGGYLLKSENGGQTWSGPIVPPPVPGEATRDPFGKTVPAYNRGAMCQSATDGKLFWVVAARTSGSSHTSTHLLSSADDGTTWTYSGQVAADEKVTFNETCLYETPRGDLVAFMRTEGFNDHTTIARSKDHGKTFLPWEDAGFQGHPHYALRLPDKRVLLVYGYRHSPFGIRCRVLDAECQDAGDAPEFVLHQGGGNGDIGYPWATMVSDSRVLVVYYFNVSDGTRYIAGNLLGLR